ncbi:hypothetical protein L9F63_018010, partial [Diploptera punctata]
YDYGEVIRDSLLFYEAQRSGKLPSDQKVTWRKDSALNDKGQNGEDLTGGYYDAGDFIKFGFPMAFTTTVLAWSIVDYEAGYQNANALDDARKAVKWATDYFIKCHVSANKLYGQVGLGELDHNSWGRPEDMTMERPENLFFVAMERSDLAGETAAAMAAASIVFKNVDSSYSNTLLSHAEQLFTFANTKRKVYSESIADALHYRSTGYEDELVWGAIWLYKATGNSNYLTTAEQLYSEFQMEYFGGNFGWDQKVSGAEVLLAKATQNSKYSNNVKSFCDYMINTQQKTPKGLLFVGDWGSLRSASNVIFICLEAADMGISSSEYRSFAEKQIGYMLGDGGRSYVVGYGNNPPSHEHHRSSSCPDAPATCDWNTFNLASENPHVLYGALVGGPGENDDYQDVRNDAQHNEVACDYNACFQAALAALNS